MNLMQHNTRQLLPVRIACLLLSSLAILSIFAVPAGAISRDPNGVNVNSQGATTVFITFGGLNDQVPVEAIWCGELIPAAPDIGMKCDPTTVFGRLPLRLDQSRLAAGGGVFTDIMSIPPSVARRAYQAATEGQDSRFFYVRRFVSTSGGPDEYVFVTCRLTGGGARTPLALVDVAVSFDGGDAVTQVARGTDAPTLQAEISYTGTGRLRGRWEVVMPSDEPPTSRDLLTEATLPPAERNQQRRYTQVGRFNVFLPPTGRIVLEGPDPSLLPTQTDGLYQVLLRVEASADKEADSNLASAGAGQGVIHAGAVAGFPMPTLRYFVGQEGAMGALSGFDLVSPKDGVTLDSAEPQSFAWTQTRQAHLYRLEIATEEGTDEDAEPLFTAVVQQGIGLYRPPSWVLEQNAGQTLRWRVVALDTEGSETASTPWRSIEIEPAL